MSLLVVVVVLVLLVVELLKWTYIRSHIQSQTLKNLDFPRHSSFWVLCADLAVKNFSFAGCPYPNTGTKLHTS